jgi:hypothetical protein
MRTESPSPLHPQRTHWLRGLAPLAAAAALCLALPAQAAPVTLHLQGSFTATNSAASLNSAAAKALAGSVNGTSSWNTLSNIALSFEIDLDDTLTRTQLATNTWNWFLDDITEIRIQLGNAHFATRGSGGNSLGSILVGATDTEAAPAPALSTGMLLRMSQPWSRDTTVSPVRYSFAGATPQVSGGGVYEHFFRTAYDASEGNRVLDFWGTLASNDSLTSSLPTGRWRLTDFGVTPQAVDPAGSVPEPSTLSLLVLALAALMALRRR